MVAGKTAKSILVSCGARLAPFDIKELREITAYDELELDTLGDKKTALFLIMSDTDVTFNFMISMVYTQLFNLLCEKADDVYGGRLPVHVRCLIDEAANIGQIPNLEKLVATIRSREISACLVLQAKSQLKAIYKDNADTIIGNMDSQVFLGGTEQTKIIENSVATNMVSEGLEDILASARKNIRCNNIANWGLWIFGILSCGGVPIWIAFFLAFMVLKVYVRTKGRVDLEYVIDDDQQEIIKKRMKPMLKVTESAMVWRIMQTSKVVDKKYASGASNEVKRVACKASTTAPFPFKSNATCATFKTGKEYLVFLPDKLFVIQKKKIGALSYSDIQTNSHLQRFIEDGAIPKDAVVVGKTWKYVNKSGGPDKRFKDNRELPICQYGEIELSSTSGLNTVLMFSKIDLP